MQAPPVPFNIHAHFPWAIDPCFSAAVHTFSLAFHHPGHTVASVIPMSGGNIELWDKFCEGLIGGCVDGGSVHVAIINEGIDGGDMKEIVVGVIGWAQEKW